MNRPTAPFHTLNKNVEPIKTFKTVAVLFCFFVPGKPPTEPVTEN